MRTRKMLVLGLWVLVSGPALAASDISFVGWPGDGAPLPTLSPGAVQPDDDSYAAPGANCLATGIPQLYDSLVFTNAGNTSENIVYTVTDANGGCLFPDPTGTPASNAVRVVAYVGADAGAGQGPFNPSTPTSNCVQVVTAGAGVCPTVTVPLSAFQVATLVISTASIVTLPPNGPTPSGSGSGLFGYQGGLGGSTPVSLQSFSVDQGP